jgi:hypothetical protein
MQTPVQYYQRYHSITVPASDGSGDLATGITVDRYRLGAQEAFMNERGRLARKVKKDLQLRKQADPAATIKVRVSRPGGYEEREFTDLQFTDADQLWALLRYPYVGKGSPEAIQVALQLGALEMQGSPAIVSPADFQSYCDRWFGLDCNGFVGNFLRHEAAGIPWHDVNLTDSVIESNSLISDIWRHFEGTARSHASEIDYRELNLMVLVDSAGKVIPGGAPNHGHIVISGPGERADIYDLDRVFPVAADQGVPALCVVESTGAVDSTDGKSGLSRSFYAAADHPQLPGVMRVHRGLNGKLMNVRVKGAHWPM